MDDDAVEAVVHQGEQITEQPGEDFHRTTLQKGSKPVGRKTIQRGPGKRHVVGKDFHLADEIRYIQRRAAEHDGRFVTVGSLALFSTDTGDAWLLDTGDHLAARLARDGDPEDVYLRKRTPSLPSAGRANTASMAMPSSISTETPAPSSLSWATPSGALQNGADREISNIFG